MHSVSHSPAVKDSIIHALLVTVHTHRCTFIFSADTWVSECVRVSFFDSRKKPIVSGSPRASSKSWNRCQEEWKQLRRWSRWTSRFQKLQFTYPIFELILLLLIKITKKNAWWIYGDIRELISVPSTAWVTKIIGVICFEPWFSTRWWTVVHGNWWERNTVLNSLPFGVCMDV